jgi:uncharacterized iron-regulated protein
MMKQEVLHTAISSYAIQSRHVFNLFLWIATVFLSFTSQAQSPDSQLQRSDAKIYLLGEVHDNPSGHTLRLELVMQLISQKQKPVVAMEQFDRENQQALDLALTSCQEVDCVLAKVAAPGWDWLFYKPYVQLAIDKKVTLVAANLSNTDVRKVMSQGFSVVYSALEIAEYKLGQLPTHLLNDQRKSIQEGHCNMLPMQAVDSMVRGQIARDVWMASIINNAKNKTIILIAGNGHVRKDAGVFQWLTRENQLTTQVHGYVEQTDKKDANWYDHVHVIPTIEREDPCRVFEKNRSKK